MRKKKVKQKPIRHDEYVRKMGKEIMESEEFLREKNYLQHGRTTTYEHSIRVALLAMKIARIFRLNVDYESLIRGCLLHDYFLYDWHQADPSHRLHGFRHGRTAAENAMRDFGLNQIEYNMIMAHMFPLWLAVPRDKESLLVGLADKYRSLIETCKRK